MPILSREPDLYPADLLEPRDAAAPRAPSHDVRWWALYTLARREKDLVRRLRAMHVAHYCPLVPRRTKSPQGRVRTAYVPLFAGYVFVRGTEEDRYRAMTTNVVSRWLEVPRAEELVADLRQIQRLVACGAPLTPEARLEPGERVRIRRGPFVGFEGQITKRLSETRLVVAVRFLQQGASVLLDDFEVERID